MKRQEIDANGVFYVPEEHSGNIWQRMLQIEAELGVVAKNIEIPTTKTNGYKAVSERDVIDAVKPLEARYGVYSYPYSRQIITAETLSSDRLYNGQTQTVYSKFVRIETVYRFVNIDKPEEFVEVTTYGDGIDTADKALPKAMTFADKYALMKAYKISTGDDPDQTKSPDEGYRVKESAEPKATEKQVKLILSLIQSGKINGAETAQKYGVGNIAELTIKQASDIIKGATDGDRIRR